MLCNLTPARTRQAGRATQTGTEKYLEKAAQFHAWHVGTGIIAVGPFGYLPQAFPKILTGGGTFMATGGTFIAMQM